MNVRTRTLPSAVVDTDGGPGGGQREMTAMWRMCRRHGTVAALATAALAAVWGASGAPAEAACGPQSGLVADSLALLATAQQHTTAWDGPTTGPKASPGKLVVYVAQDMRNGGVLGVSQGVQSAAAAIGWKLKIIDGVGTVAGRVSAINQAVALKPAGIVLGSVDAQEEAAAIRAAAQQGIKIVGWHSAAAAGPVQDPPIFTNVTTEAVNVAKVAAAYALQTTNCTAGAVIFWQSGDAIGIKKAEMMRDVIKACGSCKVLDYVNTPLADTAARMPQNTTSLLQRFGAGWTVGRGTAPRGRMAAHRRVEPSARRPASERVRRASAPGDEGQHPVRRRAQEHLRSGQQLRAPLQGGVGIHGSLATGVGEGRRRGRRRPCPRPRAGTVANASGGLETPTMVRRA